MANPIWAKTDDVKERLKNVETASGHEDPDVENCLTRAEKEIRAKLQSHIASSELNGWTDQTVPAIVRSWVADVAAAFLLSDFYGESFLDKATKAGGLYGKVQTDLKDVRLGTLSVVDISGDTVQPAEDTIQSDKTSRTATHTMTHADDSDAGDGSLDEL